jgi:succinyl-CoA synthetase beta subunit
MAKSAGFVQLPKRHMDLYEFEAKKWLHKHGLPVEIGAPAYSAREAKGISETMWLKGYTKQVVKAQVLSGGRKKAGGILFASSPAEVEEHARRLIGS